MPDHVHMCSQSPRKHSAASVIGFLKGKSAMRSPDCAAKTGTSRASISGPAVYAVCAVGFELEQVRQYICEQEPR